MVEINPFAEVGLCMVFKEYEKYLYRHCVLTQCGRAGGFLCDSVPSTAHTKFRLRHPPQLQPPARPCSPYTAFPSYVFLRTIMINKMFRAVSYAVFT
jgi:hypothetical protein